MTECSDKIKLLPPSALIRTSKIDHAEWNFQLILGWIQRLRFKLVVSLLPLHQFHRLLEVGYGSGVFMTELAGHCEELYGIDIHQKQKSVSHSLARFNVTANLFSADVAKMPFRENFFDCVVAISTLEFVSNLDAACTELKRVLTPSGVLFVVTPGNSVLADLGLKLLTGKNAKDDYSNRRDAVISTLLKHFKVEKQVSFPRFGCSMTRLYTALKLTPRS